MSESPSRSVLWIASVAATVPICAVLLLHVLFAPEGMRPTGFLQHDQAYYMMNARATHESGRFPLYRLPFSADYDSPAIYFQPLSVVLGGIVRATHLDPGFAYAVFGLVCAVVMFRIALDLYHGFGGHGGTPGWLGRVAFLWGGGLLVVAGALTPSSLPRGEAILQFDPFQGYWFLNLGRNAFYGTEAFYHAVFFATVLFLLRRRYSAAFACLLLESASHPFTGVQLLLIVAVFCMVEWALDRRQAPPSWFTLAVVATMAAHVAYYVVLLKGLSPEHRLLEAQWSLPWTVPLTSMAFGHGSVAVLALFAILRTPRALMDSRIRLALVWAIVSLLLAKHEWFISPRQPLHFTRGYIWTPLALLALPVFEALFARLLRVRFRPAGVVMAGIVLAVVFSDNALWFLRVGRQIVQGRSWTLYLPREADFVFERLSAPDMRGRLLVSDDDHLAYMALLHTPLRAWHSHPFNTPDSENRRRLRDQFFATGEEPASWSGRRPVIVTNQSVAPWNETLLTARGYRLVAREGRFAILEKL